jgi:hypothetical protein
MEVQYLFCERNWIFVKYYLDELEVSELKFHRSYMFSMAVLFLIFMYSNFADTSKCSGCWVHHLLNVQNLCIMHKKYIHLFWMILRMNNKYLHFQNEHAYVCVKFIKLKHAEVILVHMYSLSLKLFSIINWYRTLLGNLILIHMDLLPVITVDTH